MLAACEKKGVGEGMGGKYGGRYGCGVRLAVLHGLFFGTAIFVFNFSVPCSLSSYVAPSHLSSDGTDDSTEESIID